MAIVVPVISEWSPKGLNAAIADITKAKGALGGLDDSGRKASNQFSNLGGSLKKFGGIVAGAFATVQIGQFFKTSIQGAIEAEAVTNRLRQILLTTGAATEVQIDALMKQADALERVGVVSKENIITTQAQLATFDLQASTIAKLTPAILDYATAEKGANVSGDELKSMTNGLSQALNGQFGALTRVGFTLTDQQKKLISTGTESERAAALVEILSSTYGGFNEQLTKTPEGRLIKLQQEFSKLKDEIGKALLPVFERVMAFLVDDGVPALRKIVDGVVELTKKFEPTVKILEEKLVPAFEFWYNFISQVVVPGLKRTFMPIFEGLQDAFEIVGEAIDRNRDKFQPLFDFLIKFANFVYTSLGPLIGQVLGGAFRTLGKIIGVVLDVVARAIPPLVSFLEKTVNDGIRVVNFFIRQYSKLPEALQAFGAIDEISQLTFPKFESTGVKAFESVSEAVEDSSNILAPSMNQISKSTEKATDKLKAAKDAAKKLKDEAIKAAEAIVSNLKDSLDKASKSLDDAKDKFKDFKDAISGTITGIIDFGKAAERENFLEGLVEQANNAKVFADKVRRLVQIGLSERAIRLVLDAGYEAGSLIADQIIEGGSSIVTQVNELVASVATVAEQVGEAGAELFYGEGVRQAQSLVNGIQAELDRAQINLDKIKISGELGGTAGTGATTAGTGTAPTSATYVVKPGDSLSAIARKNNTTLQDILNANPKFTDQAKYNGGSTIFSGTTVKIPRKAMGGLVSGRMPYIVGENGPELFMPDTNGSITPNNESRNLSGGVYNITVNAGLGTNGRQVGALIVEAIKKYENSSGQVFARA